MALFQSSSDRFSSGPGRISPALFTSTSQGPKAAALCSAAAATLAALPTSQAMAKAWPPAALI